MHQGCIPQAQVLHALQHLVARCLGAAGGAVGPQARRALRQGHQQGGLGRAQVAGRLAQIGAAGHFHTLHLAAHGGVVQVQSQNLTLAEVPFKLQGAGNLAQLGAHAARGRAAVGVIQLQNARYLHGQR